MLLLTRHVASLFGTPPESFSRKSWEFPWKVLGVYRECTRSCIKCALEEPAKAFWNTFRINVDDGFFNNLSKFFGCMA